MSSDYDVIEVGSDPAVGERLCCLGQDLFFRVAAGNVGKDELLHVARGGKRSRFRRSEMPVVARHVRIAIEKRRLDHQHVGVSDTFRQPFRGFGVAHDDELFTLGRRPENILRLEPSAVFERHRLSFGQRFAGPDRLELRGP
jgi:hypothetical protein